MHLCTAFTSLQNEHSSRTSRCQLPPARGARNNRSLHWLSAVANQPIKCSDAILRFRQAIWPGTLHTAHQRQRRSGSFRPLCANGPMLLEYDPKNEFSRSVAKVFTIYDIAPTTTDRALARTEPDNAMKRLNFQTFQHVYFDKNVSMNGNAQSALIQFARGSHRQRKYEWWYERDYQT